MLYKGIMGTPDIYDHEVEQIEAALEKLSEKSGTMANYGAFEREARDRFAAIGFTVDINWYEYSVNGVKGEGAMPDITITGRTDPNFTFDPDRQVHEIVQNYLDLPGEEKGRVIKSDGILREHDKKHRH